MPVTSGQSAPAAASASRRQLITPSAISPGSCSTRPGAPNALVTGRLAIATGSRLASKATHRLDELPWSTARITGGMKVSPGRLYSLGGGRRGSGLGSGPGWGPGCGPGGGRQDLPDLAADRRSSGKPALEDGAADSEPPRAGRVE